MQGTYVRSNLISLFSKETPLKNSKQTNVKMELAQVESTSVVGKEN
jgi:hypothetical protein